MLNLWNGSEEQLLHRWPKEHCGYEIKAQSSMHEANMLKLDCSKAFIELDWSSRWSIEKALDATMEWFINYVQGNDIRMICERQIADYEASVCAS